MQNVINQLFTLFNASFLNLPNNTGAVCTLLYIMFEGKTIAYKTTKPYSLNPKARLQLYSFIKLTLN